MKSIFELCTPRKSVFDNNSRDDALDLRSIKTGNIDSEKFFAETYMTDGLKSMVDAAFKRLAGTNDSHPVIKLTQSMGGGKTHLLITTALLAKDPVLRYKIFGDKYNTVKDVRIVSYTGRDTDIKYGIWGEIARQLGKEDLFKDYYNPLSAPGQEAWINLLKSNSPTLILLDELPPYLEYAKAVPVGTGDLANYTVAALSNLFNAVASPELGNVLIVISDLNGNYMSGSELIETALSNATKTVNAEVDRLAYKITPVRRDNDDLYNILKKKCFETLPENDSSDVREIASGYKEALSKAKQSGATIAIPESLYTGIISSYPFHPSLKEIFGKFKNNENFQQTRGCIRLVRNMVRCLWNGEHYSDKFLINSYDVNLRDIDTYNTVKEIKPELEEAISHDIVSQGGSPAQAEECDREAGGRTTEEVAKLILMSSLSTIPGATLGLNKNDMAAFMVTPTFSVAEIGNILENFKDRAWYLFAEDERLFFKQNRNIKAQIATLKNSYPMEIVKRHIRDSLGKLFKPILGDVYQKVLVFPGTDEIALEKDKVTLVLFEPNTSGNGGLSSALLTWYDAQTYKNRVCFLTGQHNNMQDLYDRARDVKAVESVIEELKNNNVKEKDSQMVTAVDYQVRAQHRFKTALKEIFVTLYYPFRNGIQHYEIEMDFKDNNFVAEDQIRKLLKETVHKFIAVDDIDAFRQRIEARLFTAQTMTWSQLEERAAEREDWSWYKPNTLKAAKDTYLQRGYWIERNGVLDKNPPKPKTSVTISEQTSLRDGADVILKLNPLHGDTIYCEIGQNATTASRKISMADWEKFKTDENKLCFLCVDSKNNYETGENVIWENKYECQYRTYDDNGNKMVEFKTNGKDVDIRYTIDGSDPRSRNSIVYNEPFAVPEGDILVHFVPYVKKYGFYGIVTATTVYNSRNKKGTENIEINPDKPLTLTSLVKGDSTKDTYELLNSLEKVDARIFDAEFNITNGKDDKVVEFSFSGKGIDIAECRKYLDTLSEYFSGDASISAIIKVREIRFNSGKDFSLWVADTRREVKDFKGHFSQI